MGDCMVFPKDWEKFLEDYSFRDREEVYTNGARLIPTFRVEQMMEHYLEKATEDAVPVVHGRWVKDEEASKNHIEYIYVCSSCENCEAWGSAEKTNYCPYCGAKMDLEVE